MARTATGRQEDSDHLGATTRLPYIQLRDFKRGDRKNDIMQPIASSMNARTAGHRDISRKSRGLIWGSLVRQRKFRTGLERQPLCGLHGCHLDQFQGDGTVPRLAGQSRDYLTKTIADFARAHAATIRQSDLMLATAPDDLAALTEYLAGR